MNGKNDTHVGYTKPINATETLKNLDFFSRYIVCIVFVLHSIFLRTFRLLQRGFRLLKVFLKLLYL